MACKGCIHYNVCRDEHKDKLKCSEYRNKADYAEVKHGEWIDDMKVISTVGGVEMKALVGYRCSLCGRAELRKEPYCNCGAKMDGGTYETR